MLKNEFLKMMKQDLETSDNGVLKQLLLSVEEFLQDFPASTEIDSAKSISDLYAKMEVYAKKNAKGSRFVFGPLDLKKFFLDYFGLKEVDASFFKLEDFI